MSWTQLLPEIKKKGGSSQFEESEIIDFIFQNVDPGEKIFVDLGAGGYGSTISNCRDLYNNGWKGLGVDGEDSKDEYVIKRFITPDTIVDLLKEHDIPKRFSFLNLDIDSSDYWVLKNLLEAGFGPTLICTEFNGTIDPESTVALQYEEGYTWDGTNKYGYSFRAGVNLLESYGYHVVFNQHETNLFAVLSSYLKDEDFVEVKAVQSIYHRVNKDAVWVDVS